MSSLVTIIIPAYNHEKYIATAIQSAIEQTYENIELIIINDGSPDRTAEVIRSLEDKCKKRFINFIFLDRENWGLNKTLNQALQLAKGEYIAPLDSDDAYEKNAIEILVQFLDKHPDYGLAVGDNNFIDSEGNRCYWTKNRNLTHDKNKAYFSSFGDYLKKNRTELDFNSGVYGSYETLLENNYITNGYLIRACLLKDKIGGYNEKFKIQDHYVMLQLSKCSKLKYFDRPLLNYRWHENNNIKNKNITKGHLALIYETEKEYAQSVGAMKHLVSEKKDGIPFIFEIIRKRTEKGRLKIFKLFGIIIYKHIKL